MNTKSPAGSFGRRRFLHSVAALPATAGIAGAQQDARRRRPASIMNGIQMGPHNMLDEGVDRSLDLIQETADINTLLVYSHTYHADIRKPPRMLATDHGVPPQVMRNRKLPSVWIRHNEQSLSPRCKNAIPSK